MALMHHQRDCSGHPVITTQVVIEGGERQTEDGKSFRASWHTSTGRYGNVVVQVLVTSDRSVCEKTWREKFNYKCTCVSFSFGC